MRNVKGKGRLRKRYVNYNIFGAYENVGKHYTMPTRLELLSVEPVSVSVAEGPFDALSVGRNLGMRSVNSIVSAAGGKDMTSTFIHHILEYRLINAVLHASVDNDTNTRFIDKMANDLKVFGFPLYVHRNAFEGEKDHGVDLSRISDIVERVL
jgi:hypothetical protein